MDTETNLELLKIAASLIIPSTVSSADVLEANYRKILSLFKEGMND